MTEQLLYFSFLCQHSPLSQVLCSEFHDDNVHLLSSFCTLNMHAQNIPCNHPVNRVINKLIINNIKENGQKVCDRFGSLKNHFFHKKWNCSRLTLDRDIVLQYGGNWGVCNDMKQTKS